jgi:hypothetical protein
MKDARGKPTNVIRVKANHKNSEADRGSRVSQLTPSRSNVFPDLLLWTSQNTNFGCAFVRRFLFASSDLRSRHGGHHGTLSIRWSVVLLRQISVHRANELSYLTQALYQFNCS